MLKAAFPSGDAAFIMLFSPEHESGCNSHEKTQ